MSLLQQTIVALILVLPFFPSLHGFHFLILGGVGSGSHYYVATAIGRELAYRGNNVSVLISDMYASNETQRDDADLFSSYVYKSLVTEERFQSLLADMVHVSLHGDLISKLKTSSLAEAMGLDQCESILIDTNIRDRLRRQKIDLIIGDFSYICVGLVAQYLDVPFALLSPASISVSIMSEINVCPTDPAFIPDVLTGLDQKMNFMERVTNTITVSMQLVMNRRMLSNYDQFKIKYNIKPDISTFKTLGDADLWFINADFALEFPRPLMPHVVPVGGLTTNPAKQLPKELESFVQSSEDGVIIFSLGSYCSITDQSMADMFGEAISQVSQKVIWKRKGKEPQRIPSNVKMMDVIPQNDLLGHPKIRLIIYQCGINGIFEALYHGVPIICIPIFFDQFDNAQRVASRGIGLRLDIRTLTSKELLDAINTVLGDESFKSNVVKLSAIFRDNPKTPAQRAADWAEFAARHNGTKHLRSAAHDLTFIQYHLIDVWAFIIGCIVLFVGLLITCCRFTLRLLCGSSKKVKKE
ncbi:UDP-glucuronosyltransferase 2B17-like isoform X3 [Amphiura filiformis]|uniref:UDP-glucuronosyltransferase 2B17-like isoform X3 n=1 Tax=Amphiura filiformis TaxID=82378 RepID=UPI003B2221C1